MKKSPAQSTTSTQIPPQNLSSASSQNLSKPFSPKKPKIEPMPYSMTL